MCLCASPLLCTLISLQSCQHAFTCVTLLWTNAPYRHVVKEGRGGARRGPLYVSADFVVDSRVELLLSRRILCTVSITASAFFMILNILVLLTICLVLVRVKIILIQYNKTHRKNLFNSSIYLMYKNISYALQLNFN